MSDKSSSRTRKVVLWGLVLVVVLSLVSFVVLRSRSVHDVDRRLAGIRAAGLPTNGEELNKWYAAVPDRENAALVMTQAVDLLQFYDSSDSRYRELSEFKMPPRGQQLDAKQRRLLSNYVEMNAPALAKAHEAVKRPKARYPVDLSQGLWTPLPHLQLNQLNQLARIEEYAVLLALPTGRSNQTAASITSILDMARTLENEPVVISQSARNSMLGRAKSALERSLAMVSFGDSELARLQQAFSQSEKTNLTARAFIGNRAAWIPIFRTNVMEIERIRQMLEKGMFPTGETQPLTEDYRTRHLNRDLLFYLDVMETNIVTANLPPPLSLTVETNAQAVVAAAKQKKLLVSQMCLSGPTNLISRELIGLTHLRLSTTALALERFRVTHGRLPERLEELLPRFLAALPTNPFDGPPLRYRRLARGYVIQSGDQEQKNSGESDTFGLNRDLTFTVER